MSNSATPKPGTIAWHDLTVPNAEKVRDFYQAVVGWKPEPVEMGDYSDFSMIAPNGEGVAGVCHARGANADLPAQWLMYVIVEDVDASAKKCVELGGKVITGPRSLGSARFAVIQDPAGAVCAIYQPQ
jgi:predicted enzyme related to lactoylglutathione lyase